MQALKNITQKDIAKLLKDNEIYIDFAKAGENYYYFVLDKKENLYFERLDRAKEIEKLIKSFRDDLVSFSKERQKRNATLEVQKKLSKLYNLIFVPKLEELIKNKDTLIISTDGALKLLPFEALFNRGYLIEQKDIKYIPSAKELVRVHRFSKVSKNRVVEVFANPIFDLALNNRKIKSKKEMLFALNSRSAIIKSFYRMDFSPLPGTAKEAKEIKKILKNKKVIAFIKERASEENLLKAKAPKVLHIATHGFFLNDKNIPNPMLKAGVALSGANEGLKSGSGYGVVTALKLSGLNLKGTNLVVLSACDTGVVDINATENVSALEKAFIQAGASNIITTLWKIDDEATVNLMSSFYKESLKTKSYSKALKEAKLKMIKDNLHPYFWAGFILSGI